MKFSIISCITGESRSTVVVNGITSWNTRREAEDVLNNLGVTNGLDPDDFYTTRSPERVPEILQAIAKLWNKNPDIRLGQMLDALMSYHQELFQLDDDVLLRKLKNAITSGFAAGAETI